ncbi:MAG: YicC family protein [Eubacteriales bacterium]|nr:YicC family protein [Eubacteriales bacterium]MDD4389293.1 YicC family protein [Eubacteriales bacterium]
MIKSMTGFGKGEYDDSKRSIIVEIKTVNHRYTDISVRMPRRYTFAEDKIKSTIKKTVKRGKVDISIIVDNVAEGDVKVRLNAPVAKQYYENLNELKVLFGMEDDINLEFLAGFPDVIKTVPDVEDEEEITNALLKAVDIAGDNLDKMRIAEGNKLADDLIMRAGMIRDFTSQIEEKAPLVKGLYLAKLRDRIKDLIGDSIQIAEDRILLEAAVFADKCNITEELVRLDSHIIQLNNIITESNGADGKKLDFLVQEMNREANTIGSKANDIGITNVMLEIKSEIEKIREQVQNIE